MSEHLEHCGKNTPTVLLDRVFKNLSPKMMKDGDIFPSRMVRALSRYLVLVLHCAD